MRRRYCLSISTSTVNFTSSPIRGGGTSPEAIVAALDRSARREAADRLALHVLLRWRGAVQIEGHALGDAVDGQVADQMQLAHGTGQRGGLERHRGVLRYVEEVGGLQVRVALGHAGGDGRGVDGRGRRRWGDVLAVQRTVPFTLPNAPWTWLTPMCTISKLTLECAGSIAQVDVCA